jgi:hypothetical protein
MSHQGPAKTVLVKVIHKIASLLYLFNYFFLIFHIFLCYLARFGFLPQDLFQSLFSFSLEMTTLLGRMPTWAVVPLVFFLLYLFNGDDISSCKPRVLCQTVDCYSVLTQPELHHPFRQAQIEHCTLSQLFGKRRYNLPANVGRCTEIPFMVLALVRNHKGTKLHFGHCHFSNGCKRAFTELYMLICTSRKLRTMYHFII